MAVNTSIIGNEIIRKYKMSLDKDCDIDLLLIGKTGHGKSSAGNSILRRQVFESGASTNSITTGVNFDFSEIDNRVIKVVDVRGVQETRETEAKSIALFIREMEHAVVANPRGYHAFLIVLRFGVRFTQEEVDTIKFLKAVFGETFVRDFCILVMTFGDLFEIECEGLSFKEWCERETGNFKELLSECNQRIILLNNKTKDASVKKHQVLELLKLVDQLNGKRYNDENFKLARESQIKLQFNVEVEDLREMALMKISLIFEKLERCQGSFKEEIETLELILVEAEALEIYLTEVDKGTKLLQDLIRDVQNLKSNISSEVKVNVDAREWKENLAGNMKKLDEKYATEKEKLKEQFQIDYENFYTSVEMRMRQNKMLELKLEQLDKQLKKEKSVYENNLQEEIKKRRENIKKERRKLEENYRERKSSFISSLTRILQSLKSTFLFLLRKIF
ncbi:AIG protein [Biomphalaria glabrata]|nr:AIG Resistant factor [Biomphalaria glabrata]